MKSIFKVSCFLAVHSWMGLLMPNTASAQAPDTTPPVATITPSGTHTKTAITFTISFSEPVTGMATGDLTITGGTKSTFTTVNSSTYTIAVTSPSQGTVTCTLANNAAVDLAGNPSAGTASSVTYDTVAPTITVSSPSPAAANSSGSVQYTVTYADLNFDQSTLTTGNVTLTGTATAGVVVGVSGTGTTRTVTLSNLTGNGTLGISIAAGTATDLAGNLAPVKASTVSATVDNTAPVVTTNTALLAANASTVTIAGSGFSAVEANNTVTFDNGADGTVTSSTATAMTVTFGYKPDVAGPLTVEVTDLAGNTSAPTVIRTVKPVVTANNDPIDATETTIYIEGFGFDFDPENCSVTFSGAALSGTYTPSYASPTMIIVDGIPNLMPGTLNAVVTANGVSSGTAVQVAAVNLPEGLVGRFAGVVDRQQAVNAGHGGIVDFTVASNGTLTGTIKFGSQSASFSGSLTHDDVFTIDRTLSITALSGYSTRDALSLNLTWDYFSGFTGTAADGDFKELEFNTTVYEALNDPRGIVVAADGTTYIAETGRHHILMVDPLGTVTVFAGTTDTAGNADGAVGVGTLSSPWGLALDAATGTLWVADSGNNSVRQIDTTTGTISSTSAITGLSQPVGVALNSTTVFVLEKGAHRIKRRLISGGSVTLLAGSSTGASGSTSTTFNAPEGLAINAAGTLLFVADTGNHCIRKVTIPGSGTGTITVWAGAFNAPANVEGLPTVARFNAPTSVAVDADGGVWVGDTGNGVLKLIANTGITSEHVTGNTLAQSSYLMDIRSLAIASDGLVHCAEHDWGVETATQTETAIVADIPSVELKAVDALPAAARINTYFGNGNYYVRADEVTIVEWGSGYASFVTATGNTYSMAGRLPDGTSVTSSGIVTTIGVPFHAVYTMTGSTWQASIQGNPSLYLSGDPLGGATDIQEMYGDVLHRKTSEPVLTALLDSGIPEEQVTLTGSQYKSLAYYNEVMGIDTSLTPNATFYAWTLTSPLPWEFDISQDIRFTTTTITEPAPNTNSLALGLDAATGIVTGSFTPVGTAASTANAMLVPFYGGYGHYLMDGVMSGPLMLW